MLIRSVLFCAKVSLSENSSKLFKVNQIDKYFNTARHFSLSSTRQKSEETGLHSKNDILIYKGALTSRLKFGKVLSLSSSILGIAMQPAIYQKAVETGQSLPVIVFSAVFLGFFTFVTPVLLHLVSRKYVTHLFYNPDTEEFTANTYNIIMFPVITTFKAEDVTRPEMPTMFASFYVNKKPLFVDPEGFSDIELYKKMMGFDKPVDYKLEKPSVQ